MMVCNVEKYDCTDICVPFMRRIKNGNINDMIGSIRDNIGDDKLYTEIACITIGLLLYFRRYSGVK